MIQIPADIEIDFGALLVKKAISEKFHSYYSTWLRYYPDFCHKHHFDQSNKKSLSHFINTNLIPGTPYFFLDGGTLPGYDSFHGTNDMNSGSWNTPSHNPTGQSSSANLFFGR